MTSVGRVSAINRYPVKSMQGEGLEAAECGVNGIPHDRTWALRDVASGKVIAAKREPRLLMASATVRDGRVEVTLPRGDTIAADAPEASARLSDWLGRAVQLEAATAETEGFYEFQMEGDPTADLLDIPVFDGTFFDFAPVHLMTTSSLAAAAATNADVDWDVRRFRPTIMVETEGDGFLEDAWVDRIVRVGDLRCEVLQPTIRCAMPMHPQPGLPAAPDLMPGLKAAHQALLGVYAIVATPGAVRVGDPVTVED